MALNGLGGAKSIGGCTWKASTPHQRQAQVPSTLSPQYPSGVWMECRGAPRPAPQPARDDISCYGQKLSVASAWPGAATVPTRPPSEADPSMNAFFVAQCRGADGQPPRSPSCISSSSSSRPSVNDGERPRCRLEFDASSRI